MVKTKRNSDPSNVKGLSVGQLEGLYGNLENARRNVCTGTDIVPFDELLSMVYSPEAKAQWLANYELYGPTMCFGNFNGTTPVIGGRVYPRGKDTTSSWNEVQIKMLGTHQAASALAPTLYQTLARAHSVEWLEVSPDVTNELWPSQNYLLKKNTQHILRCVRENVVAHMAIQKLRNFISPPRIIINVRDLHHYFPECIELIPPGNPDREMLRNVRRESFKSKYKTNPTIAAKAAQELGPNWEKLRAHLVSIINRNKLLQLVRKETLSEPVLNWYDHIKWYDKNKAEFVPYTEWKALLIFNP